MPCSPIPMRVAPPPEERGHETWSCFCRLAPRVAFPSRKEVGPLSGALGLGSGKGKEGEGVWKSFVVVVWLEAEFPGVSRGYLWLP